MSARLIREDIVELNFVWPSILLDSGKLSNSMVLFCKDHDIWNAKLLAQEIMEYTEQYQEKEWDEIVSTCRINLPFV